MALARAALSLPSIEAVRGVLDGIGRRDPSQVMSLVADVSEGGADLRLFVDELVIHLRALLLVRTGADARLTDELPAAEVEWLRERAPAWTVGTLIQLVQTLSEALARTRDAQQFQVQTEVALLTACDVASVTSSLDTVPTPKPEVSASAKVEEPATVSAPAKVEGAVPAPDAAALRAKWPDVVEHVKAKNGILGSLLTSARPQHLENGDALVVEFVTDFNRKRAESSPNLKLIEDALEHALGRRFRLRGTVGSGTDRGQSLLDDPVINYAARTFGGQPRRIAPDVDEDSGQ
jgi:DNA polymerase III gamma/tau subunit